MDFIDEIQTQIGNLNKIVVTLTKNPYRRYLLKTLINKKIKAKAIYQKVNDLLIIYENAIPLRDLEFYIKALRSGITQVNTIVNKKLSENKHLLTLRSTSLALIFIFRIQKNCEQKKHIQTIMPKVDIKLGTNLVQLYDGSPELIDTFIDSVELFSDSIDTEFVDATPAQKLAAQVTLVKFLKTRLTGAARAAAGLMESKAEMIAALKEQCSSTVNSDHICAKLKALKQKDSAENFCSEVEKMTSQLRTLFIKEQIPAEIANTMAIKKGVETLISGVKNTETKLILKAATFTKLNDACQKVVENDIIINTDAQILTARVNLKHGRGSRGFNTRGNMPRNNYFGRRTWHQTNRGNNRGNLQNRSRGHQRGNWSQRGSFKPHFGMFMQQSQQPMQQFPIQQQNQYPPMQPQNFQQQQQPNGNIHPLGVNLGQFTQ